MGTYFGEWCTNPPFGFRRIAWVFYLTVTRAPFMSAALRLLFNTDMTIILFAWLRTHTRKSPSYLNSVVYLSTTKDINFYVHVQVLKPCDCWQTYFETGSFADRRRNSTCDNWRVKSFKPLSCINKHPSRNPAFCPLVSIELSCQGANAKP